MSQIRPGALIAIIVFAIFAAYAYLAPATYRANALLVVESASAGVPVTMPQPLEAARRLGEAILDRKTLESLSAERAGSSAPEARAQAASGVRHALEIDTSDGHTFSIGYRDQAPARTSNACNLLARRAAEVAPQVLVDRSSERAADLKRELQTKELATFLVLHPQVAAEAPPAAGKSQDADPALSAFHAEKAKLERRIFEIETGVASDNPYVDPRESNVVLLKRRLAEIDSVVGARKAALEAKPTGATLSPELRAQWKQLLDAVSASSAEAQAQVHPVLIGRVVAEATQPSSPIEPNRHLILFFGTVFGVGLGTAFSLVARATQQRRSKSSRPPPPGIQSASRGAASAGLDGPVASQQPFAPQTTAPLPIRMPVAPPLPSDLGPSVPVTQPQRPLDPPIVPIPQRPISSSPPPEREQEPGDGHDRSSSSRPPARRFASTLVLPPTENPTPMDDLSADPLLASANTVWEQQIRAHEVPGFAVVKPGSEPPPRTSPTGSPAPFISKPGSEVPPAAAAHTTSSRPINQMKVTQPLGSFLTDAWTSPANGARPAPQPSPIPPPRSPSPTPPPPSGSQYSYISTHPSASHPSSVPPSSRPRTIRVREVKSDWRPDPSLTPEAQRALCESLYPYAVENCFVLAVISVPESTGYKSRVAAEIALMVAESGHPRVLLLEGDFQRPWVQRTMRIETPVATGFSQQLNRRTQSGQQAPWSVLGCSKSLHVLAEGMMRMPGLMLSRHFADCLRELRGYYDFIVIDGPTTSLDIDAGALNAVTDGIVTVCPARGSANLAHLQGLFAQKRFSAFATAPG